MVEYYYLPEFIAVHGFEHLSGLDSLRQAGEAKCVAPETVVQLRRCRS